MAAIGAKGGAATGEAKRRGGAEYAEYYRDLAWLSHQKQSRNAKAKGGVCKR